MIVCKNVSLSLGKKTVLQDLHFSIRPGEMLAILGPSGAGKSSVFKLLIGEYKPTIGSVKVDDFSLRDLTKRSLQAYRRGIGVVFQDFRLLPKKTVYENVAFALEVCGEGEQVAQKVPQLLEMVGLQNHAKHFPHQLSGGESQKTCIARALVHDPKILIADEPTGNLDPKNAREVIQLFQYLHQTKKMTVILSTHDPTIVEALRPRIIRLDDGKISFDEAYQDRGRAFVGMQ